MGENTVFVFFSPSYLETICVKLYFWALYSCHWCISFINIAMLVIVALEWAFTPAGPLSCVLFH